MACFKILNLPHLDRNIQCDISSANLSNKNALGKVPIYSCGLDGCTKHTAVYYKHLDEVPERSKGML